MRPVVVLRLDFPDAYIELRGDAFGRAFGTHYRQLRTLRPHLTPRVREDIAIWNAIQKERARQGLPPLRDEEMPIG